MSNYLEGKFNTYNLVYGVRLLLYLIPVVLSLYLVMIGMTDQINYIYPVSSSSKIPFGFIRPVRIKDVSHKIPYIVVEEANHKYYFLADGQTIWYKVHRPKGFSKIKMNFKARPTRNPEIWFIQLLLPGKSNRAIYTHTESSYYTYDTNGFIDYSIIESVNHENKDGEIYMFGVETNGRVESSTLIGDMEVIFTR